MFRLLGLPRFGGPVGQASGYILIAMLASFTMHLLRLGWQAKFNITVIDRG